MARQATERVPVKPDTKELLDERKPDGWTYDDYLRRLMGVEPLPEGVGR